MKRRLESPRQCLIIRIAYFDEPTAGLDPNERIRFRNLISELAADRIVLFIDPHCFRCGIYCQDIILYEGVGGLSAAEARRIWSIICRGTYGN